MSYLGRKVAPSFYNLAKSYTRLLHWRMNDTQGSHTSTVAPDDSGNARDGTINGSWAVGLESLDGSSDGGAYSCANSVANYITGPTDITGSWTLIVLVRPVNVGTTAFQTFGHPTVGGYIKIGSGLVGRVGFGMNGANEFNNDFAGGGEVVAGSVNCIAMTADQSGQVMAGYINGKQRVYQTGYSISDWTSGVGIGGSGIQGCSGQFSEFVVLSGARTASEIAALAATVMPLR